MKNIHYITHYEAGLRDAKAGIYDKWYRWNAKDDGAEYERGWFEGKQEGVDYKVITCD